jgi:ribosomal protein S20
MREATRGSHQSINSSKMKTIIKETEDVLINAETEIATAGEFVIVAPKNDFAHTIVCGDIDTAKTLVQDLKNLINSSENGRVLHIVTTLSLSC